MKDLGIEEIADAVEARFSKILSEKLIPYNDIIYRINNIEGRLDLLERILLIKKIGRSFIPLTFIIVIIFMITSLIIISLNH